MLVTSSGLPDRARSVVVEHPFIDESNACIREYAVAQLVGTPKGLARRRPDEAS